MENSISFEFAKTVAVAAALIPGFIARVCASYFFPAPEKLSKEGEIGFSALGTLMFWLGFFLLTGQNFGTLSIGNWGGWESFCAVVVLAVLVLAVIFLRVRGPVWAKNLRGKGFVVPTGERSPWLVAARDWTGEENTVEVWLKSGAVYVGDMFLHPERNDHDSVVIEVKGYATRDPDCLTQFDEYSVVPETSPRTLAAFQKIDIDVLIVRDWNSVPVTPVSDDDVNRVRAMVSNVSGGGEES